MVSRIVVVVLLIMAPGFALADSYFAARAGLVHLNDADVDDGFVTGEFSADLGYGAAVAFGRKDKAIRSEFELSYRKNDLDELSVSGFGSVDVDGDVSTIAGIINLAYDFLPDGQVSPFIGGGLGFARVSADVEGLGDDDDMVFAYQLIAGLGVQVKDALWLTAEYRYFATSDPDFEEIEAEYSTHNFLIGIRHEF